MQAGAMNEENHMPGSAVSVNPNGTAPDASSAPAAARLRNAAVAPVLAVLAVLAGVFFGAGPVAAEGLATPADAVQRFVTATAAGDADAIAAMYDPKALFIAPGSAPIAGRDAIRAVFQRNFSLGRNRIAFTKVQTETGADRAATYWEWSAQIDGQDGKQTRLNGRSLVYFTRRDDGWLISADMMHVSRAK
jgi:uncharacterized protein (TIGR02246 family)